MPAAKLGDTVIVEYSGKTEDGTVVDSSAQSGNLKFLLGAGRILKPVQQALLGMEPGQSKEIRVPAREGYGPRKDELVVELSRSQLPDDLNLEVGKRLQIPGKDGKKIIATVTAISGTKVTLDANHPLAGEDLIIDVKLLKVG
jgi:peptidylprolyl isomerase